MRVNYAWGKIKGIRPKAIFQKMGKYHKKSSSYIVAWKSSFFCAICDFANHSFINTKEKSLTFSAASCDALVQNTLLFTNLMNSVLIPYLSKLTEVMSLLGGNEKYQKLHNHILIVKAVKECAEDYRMYDSGLANCKAYCEYFNLVKDSYILEGFPEFFYNTLVGIREFLKGGGEGEAEESAPNSRRLLHQNIHKLAEESQKKAAEMMNGYANKNRFGFSRQSGNHRILSEHMIEDELHNSIKNHRLLEEIDENREIKEEVIIEKDELDPSYNTTVIVDVFDHESVNPDFDEAMVNQMMQVQEIFNTGSPELYKKLLKKYYIENFNADLDDLDFPNVYKQLVLKRINYANFQTLFSFAGIDIHEIVEKINWALTVKEIGLSLTSAEAAESEMIFPQVIHAVNKVSNAEVRSFYRNQMLVFDPVDLGLYQETANRLIEDFATKKLRQIIADNMSVYNFLVSSMKQDQADAIWSQIEVFSSQLRGFVLKNSNVTATLYNYTRDGEQLQGLRIISSVNSSGYANVTFVDDIQSLIGGYTQRVELIPKGKDWKTWKNEVNVDYPPNSNGLAYAQWYLEKQEKEKGSDKDSDSSSDSKKAKKAKSNKKSRKLRLNKDKNQVKQHTKTQKHKRRHSIR